MIPVVVLVIVCCVLLVGPRAPVTEVYTLKPLTGRLRYPSTGRDLTSHLFKVTLK